MNAQESTTLKLNISAPKFKVTDIYNREINLEDYSGKRLFIGFFRHAGCPFCNLRVKNLMQKREELKALNLEMIFFFESRKELLLSSQFHKEVNPIPLIADPEKVYYQTYGVEESTGKSIMSHLTSFIKTAIKAQQNGVPMHLMAGGESFSTIPAEFLVDEKLVLRKLHYAKSLNDRISLDLITDFAKAESVINF
jgi:peroxiredoxin Q/BCP